MPLQVFCRNCAQYRHEWCDLKVDSPDPDLMRDCQYYRGMTNADRIRSMSDEELAIILAEGCHNTRECPTICAPIYPFDEVVESCAKCWLDWLKQEVE